MAALTDRCPSPLPAANCSHSFTAVCTGGAFWGHLANNTPCCAVQTIREGPPPPTPSIHAACPPSLNHFSPSMLTGLKHPNAFQRPWHQSELLPFAFLRHFALLHLTTENVFLARQIGRLVQKKKPSAVKRQHQLVSSLPSSNAPPSC